MPTPPAAVTATAPPAVPAAVDDDYDDEHGDPVSDPLPPADPTPAASPPADVAAPLKSAGPRLPVVHPETVIAATFEGLKSKHARRDTAQVPSVDSEGNQVLLEIKMKAISNPAYDKLLDAYPPNREDQARGAIWDRRKFPAALLEAVVTDPRLTFEQWMELSADENWSGGEFGDLFSRANRLCQGGLDVPFTGRG